MVNSFHTLIQDRSTAILSVKMITTTREKHYQKQGTVNTAIKSSNQHTHYKFTVALNIGIGIVGNDNKKKQIKEMIILTLQPAFTGDPTDGNDKALIAAFGDPKVNIAGSFVDPNNTSFTFQFATTENYVGITTQLSTQQARFMLALPAPTAPNCPPPTQGPMDCITPNPSEAAEAWQAVMISRISAAMATLRGNSLVPSIPPVTV